MARHLFWTERVALSVLVVFLLSIQPALSQQSRTNTITYSCRATNLESVMEFLSDKSSYHFIYSRNLVDITSPVSLTVNNKPIGEILTLIEKQANVVFKVLNRHIIVKPIPKPDVTENLESVSQPVATRVNVDQPMRAPTVTPLLTSTSRMIQVKPIVTNKSVLESRLDRRITELQATLGPNVPRDIPPMYINRINFNNRNRGLFASIGTSVSDHSTSVEVQAGFRYLYGVFQPRWSVERGLYGVYGAGNSFTLTRNFSFNTIYMLSGTRQSGTIYPFNPLGKTGPEFQVTQTMRHHQVKLAVQYSITPNFSVRLGPVLNYKAFITEVVPVRSDYGYYEGTFIYRQPNTPDLIYQNGQFGTQSVRRSETWLGWEGAISYRINFSHSR